MMLYPVIFILLIFLALILLLVTKIEIMAEYSRNNRSDHVEISFRAFRGIIEYRYEIPFLDLVKTGLKFRRIKGKTTKGKEGDVKRDVIDLHDMYLQFRTFKTFYDRNKRIIDHAVKQMEKRIVINELKLDVVIGTGDACYTAILAGAAWGIAGIAVALVSNSVKCLGKNISVKTNFLEKMLRIDLNCIFSIRFVHIIVVGMNILIYSLKFTLLKNNRRWRS